MATQKVTFHIMCKVRQHYNESYVFTILQTKIPIVVLESRVGITHDFLE